MKKYIITIIYCLFFCFSYLLGQNTENNPPVPSDSMIFKAAMHNLYGINQPFDYDKAHKMFSFLAKKNNPNALNALGVMYKDGIGVEKNYERAAKYFYLAHKNGSNEGTCNLALAFRAGNGVKKSYETAFNLFDEAAQRGYGRGYYLAGDMTYKGFGTEQDYNKAMEYFEAGAKKGNKNCLFMLGVASVEGHGKKHDIAQGEHYFHQALKRGHTWVEDVIERDMIDSIQHRKAKFRNKQIGNSHKYTENKAVNIDVEGVWNGILTVYDWSGQEIENEIPLTLEIVNYGDSLLVSWNEGKEEHYAFHAFKGNKAWYIRHLTPVGNNDKITKVLKQIKFDIGDEDGYKTLTGNVLMASPNTDDDLKPNVFKLKSNKIEAQIADNSKENITIINVFPNPFSDEIQLSVRINNKENIMLEICNMSGAIVYSKQQGLMDAGTHTLTIKPNDLPEGHYVIYLKGKNSVQSNVLIKSKNIK